MTNMVNKAQGFGLSLLTKMASSDLLDQFKLRKLIEKPLYQGSKTGFKALSQFAQEVLAPLAHQADHDAKFPDQLWQYIEDLGLNYYALPEALGGVAAEQNIVSNILIAEHLARGDFSLTAGLLSTFSVINALTRWGSEEVQSKYLTAFAADICRAPA